MPRYKCVGCGQIHDDDDYSKEDGDILIEEIMRKKVNFSIELSEESKKELEQIKKDLNLPPIADKIICRVSTEEFLRLEKESGNDIVARNDLCECGHPKSSHTGGFIEGDKEDCCIRNWATQDRCKCQEFKLKK